VDHGGGQKMSPLALYNLCTAPWIINWKMALQAAMSPSNYDVT